MLSGDCRGQSGKKTLETGDRDRERTVWRKCVSSCVAIMLMGDINFDYMCMYVGACSEAVGGLSQCQCQIIRMMWPPNHIW